MRDGEHKKGRVLFKTDVGHSTEVVYSGRVAVMATARAAAEGAAGGRDGTGRISHHALFNVISILLIQSQFHFCGRAESPDVYLLPN